MAANKLRKALPDGEWSVTVVDADDNHRYQPGYLFMPFGTYTPNQVTKSRRKYLSKGVSLVYGEIDTVEADDNAVLLTDGQRLTYDYLIIATGVTPRPDQTPAWRRHGRQRPRVLLLQGLDGARREAQDVARRQARHPHHRDADQVPRRSPGVRLPR